MLSRISGSRRQKPTTNAAAAQDWSDAHYVYAPDQSRYAAEPYYATDSPILFAAESAAVRYQRPLPLPLRRPEGGGSGRLLPMGRLAEEEGGDRRRGDMSWQKEEEEEEELRTLVEH